MPVAHQALTPVASLRSNILYGNAAVDTSVASSLVTLKKAATAPEVPPKEVFQALRDVQKAKLPVCFFIIRACFSTEFGKQHCDHLARCNNHQLLSMYD